MHEWGLAPTSICERGTLDQTADHVNLFPEDTMDCCFWMMKLDAGSSASAPASEEDPQAENWARGCILQYHRAFFVPHLKI